MTEAGRRLSRRNRLERPVEAELCLCGDASVHGWIVDEQDDGVGMMFGGEDVLRLAEHAVCCVRRSANLWLADEARTGRPIPVVLAHVTAAGADRTCRAGLAFDVARMQASDITHLLGIWRRLIVATERT